MKKILLLIAAIVFAFGLSYEDDFSSLNKDFWLVYDHGGYSATPNPPAYDKVTIENGILKMPVNETDHGPELITKYGIPITKNSVITASWRAKVHYANEYFAGGVFFRVVDYNTTYPPGTVDYNQSPDSGYYLATVYYRNYFYDVERYGHPYAGNNFGFATWNTKKIVIDPIWDEWFTTKVKIDLPNHQACMWIDDNLSGCLDINETGYEKMFASDNAYLRIHFSPYGWWTGHEMDLDSFRLDIEDNATNPEPTTLVQQIHKGWNLVGAAEGGDDFTALFASYPVRAVWKWENGKWHVWVKDENLKAIATLLGLQPAQSARYLEGYWIFADEDFNLSR